MTEPITCFRGEYAFLSNFSRSPVDLNGWTYPTVEHAYQAAKSNDPDYVDAVRCALTPAMAKRIGRSAMLAMDWEQRKVEVMRSLVRQKFRSHGILAHALIRTAPRLIIEGNDWGDRFWGMTKNRAGDWEGKNWLGIILMEVRDGLMIGGR